MEESQLPPSVNPSNFPAKLWRLVNSPRFRSICWDARGEGLLIDQPLFERELLGAGPDRAVGPAGDGAAEAIDLFKTKNFTSFVRQLNLYGFRKLLPGPEGSAAGPLLHFHSPHFRRDRPELLVQLKRLTSANKAKLAAGLEVTSRPPNRFQRLFGSVLCGDRLLPPATAAGANGLLSLGRFHQPYHRERFFPYSYISTSSQSNGTLLTNSLGRPPVPPRTWQGSLGLLPGHGASPAFPDKGVAFPMLQRLTTEVTYTLRPVASLLPLQQGSQTIATSLPKYSSSSNTASMQYSQAYYPTASLQRCSPPAHVDPLTGCAGPAASTYTHCSFFQSPPVQSPYAAEFLPSNWPCHTSDASEKTEVNLEAVFQIADKMYSPPKPKVVKVEPVESECSTPLSSGGHQLLVNSETGGGHQLLVNSETGGGHQLLVNSETGGGHQLLVNSEIGGGHQLLVNSETGGAHQLLVNSETGGAHQLLVNSETGGAHQLLVNSETGGAHQLLVNSETGGAHQLLVNSETGGGHQLLVNSETGGGHQLLVNSETGGGHQLLVNSETGGGHQLLVNSETGGGHQLLVNSETGGGHQLLVNSETGGGHQLLVNSETGGGHQLLVNSETGGGHQLLVNSETGDTPSTGDSQLELLTAVTPDVLFVMEPDQAETCSPSQPPEFLCAAQTVASIESAAVEIVRELMTAQQACEKLGEQPDHCPSQSSLIFIQQEPFSLEQAVVGAGNHVSSSLENPLTKQENTGAECESGTSDTQEFTLGTQPVNKSGEKTDSCVKPQCRKRRHSSDSDKSPDFHLLVDVACKKGCFPKEETKE